MKKYTLIIGLISIINIGCSSSGISNGELDESAPTIPANLRVSNVTENSLKLTWDASTDNVAVSSYSIYKNDVVLRSSRNTTTTITGLNENTNYSFKVDARDAIGNRSDFSNVVSVFTNSSNSTLQTATGNLETYAANLINAFPGSSGNNYNSPSNDELSKWTTIVNFILENKINDAVQQAGTIGYNITEFTDTSLTPNKVFYILEKKNTSSNHWGVYMFSKTPTIDRLVLMAPHSKYDTNTGKQAVYSFKNTQAKALFLNGTHRCNSTASSSCSGTTSACGSNAAFRISDMAHTTTSMYQKTTDILFNKISNSVFIQLHGFAKKSTDPYVIMSNGTRDTPTVDYAVKIKDALLLEDNSLTFKIAHLDTSWTRLIGFTNTQGRLINNSANPCSTSATSTTGRFIHIEQEKSKLRNDATGWKKMSDALKRAFN